MTLHFASFIVDMISWLLFGAIYGRFAHRIGNSRRRNSNITSIKFASFSFLGGLIAVGDRALPAYGFAFYHFLVAMAFAFILSLTYLTALREQIIYHIKYIVRRILQLVARIKYLPAKQMMN